MSLIINPYRFGGGGTSWDNTVLAHSPWGWWKLDEPTTSGTAADASGNGRDGTYTGAGSSGGSPGLFSGSSSSVVMAGSTYIALPSWTLAANQAFTILAFLDFSSSSLMQILSGDNTGSRRFQFRVDVGKMGFVGFAGTAGIVGHVSATAANDGAPHMGALVVDPSLPDASGIVKMYLDGSVDYASTNNSFAASGVANIAISSRSSVTITERFTGGMDEVVLIESALSAAEIAVLWAARNTP